MNKQEAGDILLALFQPVHVAGWLNRFEENHVFDKECVVSDFVDYINSVSDNPALFNTP